MISNLIPKTFSDIKLDQLFPFLGNGWSSLFSLFVSSWSVAKGKPSAASVLVADKVSSFLDCVKTVIQELIGHVSS